MKENITLSQELMEPFLQEQVKAQRLLETFRIRADKLEQELLVIQGEKKEKIKVISFLREQIAEAKRVYFKEATILQEELDAALKKAGTKREEDDAYKKAREKLHVQNEKIARLLLSLDDEKEQNSLVSLILKQENISKELLQLIKEQFILINSCTKELREIVNFIARNQQSEELINYLKLLEEKFEPKQAAKEDKLEDVLPAIEDVEILKSKLHEEKTKYIIGLSHLDTKLQEKGVESNLHQTITENKAFISPVKTIQEVGMANLEKLGQLYFDRRGEPEPSFLNNSNHQLFVIEQDKGKFLKQKLEEAQQKTVILQEQEETLKQKSRDLYQSFEKKFKNIDEQYLDLNKNLNGNLEKVVKALDEQLEANKKLQDKCRIFEEEREKLTLMLMPSEIKNPPLQSGALEKSFISSGNLLGFKDESSDGNMKERTAIPESINLVELVGSLLAQRSDLEAILQHTEEEKRNLENALIAMQAEKDNIENQLNAAVAEKTKIEAILLEKIEITKALNEKLQQTMSERIVLEGKLKNLDVVMAEKLELEKALQNIEQEQARLMLDLTKTNSEKEFIEKQLQITLEKVSLGKTNLEKILLEKNQLEIMLEEKQQQALLDKIKIEETLQELDRITSEKLQLEETSTNYAQKLKTVEQTLVDLQQRYQELSQCPPQIIQVPAPAPQPKKMAQVLKKGKR